MLQYSCTKQQQQINNFTVHTVDRKRVIKMTKQAIVENVLDMFLTSAQLEQIKHGWNAFYNNPLDYQGTIVIDMVKLALKSKQ